MKLNDLRLPVLSLSRPDSDRFGLRVFRGHATEPGARELFEEIVEHEADIAIVRVPAGSSHSLQRLERYGLNPIHADTLVYYQASLADGEPKPLRNTDLMFSEGIDSDAKELAALVAGTFSEYSSHYHANARLEPDRILAGYAEWAAGYLAPRDSGRITWVARREGVIVAFACCSHDQEQGSCEGVLYGVHPNHSRGGIYSDLIRYTQGQYRQRGYRTMKVSTQIWNLAVQKVWNREGFILNAAYDTFHINAMLSAGEMLVDREVSFTAAQVTQFASVTGDTNAVHLDDGAARKAGFESKISHGMLAGSELSRIFGTDIPGAGTLFLRSDMVFLRPIYPDRVHRLQIRYSTHAPVSGYIQAVSTIRDASGRLCLLCYSDLLKKN